MKVIAVTRDARAGVSESVAVLKRGGVIVYPTDTLYGFGVDARNREAVRRLREIKGRSRGLIFSVMLPGVEELVSLVTVDIALAGVLKLLPGPIPLYFPRKSGCRTALLVRAGGWACASRITRWPWLSPGDSRARSSPPASIGRASRR